MIDAKPRPRVRERPDSTRPRVRAPSRETRVADLGQLESLHGRLVREEAMWRDRLVRTERRLAIVKERLQVLYAVLTDGRDGITVAPPAEPVASMPATPQMIAATLPRTRTVSSLLKERRR